MSANHVAPPGPLLRTLAPALRNLAMHLRTWLDSPHPQPFQPIARAAVEGAIGDLKRKADDLDVDRPHLVIMLMGGTGVGKSTLLNALAGDAIAPAAFTRPTTRDPVVYYHRSLRTERLDPALRHCKLVAHERPELENKIIVDTPDLDSNEPENRTKLEQLLPVADVVLYVGSQEKYHDQLGWQMFREQRRRRAFAFVLNKWDRCLHPTAGGMRPDEDLLRDLAAEGFENPLLFRTAAQFRIDGTAPPAGDQFQDLVHWLELGLSRLEIEAVKARGVGQLLSECNQAIAAVCPPDITDAAAQTTAAWEPILADESETFSDVLLNTLDPHQQEIEQHFRLEGQRRFRNLMAAYLSLITRFQYVGARFRGRVPFIGGATPQKAAVNLAGFTHECIRRAGERSLDSRHKALAHKLLVEADSHGVPPDLLPVSVGAVTDLDWRERFESGLNDALSAVEAQWTQPKGPRAWLQTAFIRFCNFAPEVTLVATILAILWNVIYDRNVPTLFMVVSPFLLTLLVLVLLQIVINLVLPLRWPSIRSKFRRELVQQLHGHLTEAYLPIPAKVAESLRAERERIGKIRSEVDDVSGFLESQQRASSIEGLYGS
jgi:energy-coupling factor transporter ATP-binding protein EcfA2